MNAAVDPGTGRVLPELPAPGEDASGLAWAEGRLWVGQHEGRRILELDAETGAVMRVLESDRFVTGVTWAEGELWHGTWEGGESELRRVDPGSGQVLARLRTPAGSGVSGLESDGGALFYCGGGDAGTVRVVRRPTTGRGRHARAKARRPGPGRRDARVVAGGAAGGAARAPLYAEAGGGVGEPDVPPLAPAVANALLAATGSGSARCRSGAPERGDGRPGTR